MKPHPASLPIDELLAMCDVRRQRRSGPGGQHRNKVETAVVIVHRETGCVGEASERRSQEQNRQQAIHRLRVELALNVRRDRVGEAASELWKARLQGGKIRVSPEHEDFPPLMAEALDCLADCQWEAAHAAAKLNCSTSQLVKFLKNEYRALDQLNAARRQAGLSDLR